jgi:hypothetical protein
MWQKEQAVSISTRNGWFWIEFQNLARVNLTHTFRNLTFRTTVSIIFWVMDQGHHKWLPDRTHIQCAGRTSVAQLHDRSPVCYAEHTPTRRCMCVIKKLINRVVETCPFVGPIRYHIYSMWLVFSNTWPQLPHTAALSTFINTDGVSFPVMIQHMTPSIILIVIAE